MHERTNSTTHRSISHDRVVLVSCRFAPNKTDGKIVALSERKGIQTSSSSISPIVDAAVAVDDNVTNPDLLLV